MHRRSRVAGTRRMVDRRILFGIATAALAACSSSSGTSSGANGSCGGTNDCNPDRCVCADGSSQNTSTRCAYGVCSTGGMSECTMRCSAHGGLVSMGPAENVASSPECDAFCNKIASLGCANGACDRYFWCGVSGNQCAASVRAALACKAQNDTFMCTANGWSGTGSGSCDMSASLCAGDGGTDSGEAGAD
jgi:hypothetical protein